MMKSFSVFLCCALFSLGCSKGDDAIVAEEKIECLVEINGAFVLTELHKAPEYKNGGSEGFNNCTGEKIIYPSEARENGVEGKVEVEYEISSIGEVENIVPITNIGSGCEEAMIVALESCTQGIVFSPAEINGQAVKVKKTISANFKLE